MTPPQKKNSVPTSGKDLTMTFNHAESQPLATGREFHSGGAPTATALQALTEADGAQMLLLPPRLAPVAAKGHRGGGRGDQATEIFRGQKK